MTCTCGTGWGDRVIREAPRPADTTDPIGHASFCDEWLGEDPGKPEHGQPMWQFWLMVAPLILITGLVIASQVWP